jgi:molecular chaperone GrpE (heat shock protein)
MLDKIEDVIKISEKIGGHDSRIAFLEKNCNSRICDYKNFEVRINTLTNDMENLKDKVNIIASGQMQVMEKIDTYNNKRNDEFLAFRKWFIGILVTVILGIFGSLITSLEIVNNRTDKRMSELTEKVIDIKVKLVEVLSKKDNDK